MTDTEATALAGECTCAEVYGEDPRCDLHGFATGWRLVNTTPEEWLNIAVETLATVDMLDAKLAALRQPAAPATALAGELERVRRTGSITELGHLVAVNLHGILAALRPPAAPDPTSVQKTHISPEASLADVPQIVCDV